eukprot:498320-Heterocapsa_arctica.AAC.1
MDTLLHTHHVVCFCSQTALRDAMAVEVRRCVLLTGRWSRACCRGPCAARRPSRPRGWRAPP